MGFWKTLGKIAAIAAPIAAAPFTGGASLALIGAGSGAAGGLLSGGGVKGALMGAGLGAIPGLAGAGQAAKSGVQAAAGAGMKLSTLGQIANIAQGVAPLLGGLSAGRAQGQQDDADMERVGATTQQGLATAQNNALLAEMQARIAASGANQEQARGQVQDTARGDMLSNVQDARFGDTGRVKVQHMTGGVRPSALGPNARAAGGMLSNQGLAGLQSQDDEITAPDFNTDLPEYERPGEPTLLDKVLGVAGPAVGILGALGGQQSGQGQGQPVARDATADREAMEALLMDPARDDFGDTFEDTRGLPRVRTKQPLFTGR